MNGRPGQAPARRCLDWTERRHHVAGLVGTSLAELALRRGWIRRLRGTQSLTTIVPRCGGDLEAVGARVPLPF